MTTVIIANFSGMTPIIDASLLPDSNAQYSENTWLYRGLIRGYRHAALAHTNKYTDTQQVYRIPLNNVNPPDFTDAGSQWLEYPDPFMATLRNPTINDQWNRYYFFPSDQYNSSGVNPTWPRGGAWTVTPQYNTLDRIQAGQPTYILGIPVPTLPPVVTPAPELLNKTATAVTLPGNTVLNLNNTTNILVGMEVLDTTEQNFNLTCAGGATPVSDTVINFAGGTGNLQNTAGALMTDLTTTTTDAALNAPANAGTDLLYFSSVSGIYVGMVVTDPANPSNILAGTTVASVNGILNNISITTQLINNISSGELIRFVSTGAIPLATRVVWATATQVAMNNGAISGGILTGDQINFQSSGSIITGTAVQWVTSTQVGLTAPLTAGGMWVGDNIQFSTVAPESRAYVYTYVSAYSEEGPPSPADVQTGDPTGTWTVKVYNPTAAEMAQRNLTAIRIYRTVVDSSGNASYYQVTQIPITGAPGAAQTYTDTALPNEITGNQQLQTVGFTGPPSDLQGVVLMANGIAAGFSNTREVWFSAAYQLWAWPASYALSVDYPIVGLAANGSSLYVMTEGPPFLISGVTPNTMTVSKLNSNEPCIGRGSISVSAEGAYYASPNGVMEFSASADTNITKAIYEKEFHFSILPWTWAAGRYGESYVAYSKGAGIPNVDPDKETLNGLVLDNQNPNVVFSFLRFNATVLNLYQDELSGQLFSVLSNGTVMQWNPPIGKPGSTTLWAWEWTSKKFRFTMPQQFKAFLVMFDIPPEVTIKPGVRNTDPNQVFNPATQYLIIQIYADGMLLTTREVQVSGEVLLINNGSKWTYWEIRFQGQVQVRMFKMASSVKELRAA